MKKAPVRALAGELAATITPGFVVFDWDCSEGNKIDAD
jgi:hypothetical protein